MNTYIYRTVTVHMYKNDYECSHGTKEDGDHQAAVDLKKIWPYKYDRL